MKLLAGLDCWGERLGTSRLDSPGRGLGGHVYNRAFGGWLGVLVLLSPVTSITARAQMGSNGLTEAYLPVCLALGLRLNDASNRYIKEDVRTPYLSVTPNEAALRRTVATRLRNLTNLLLTVLVERLSAFPNSLRFTNNSYHL